jgi:hypothetical protein
MHPCAQIRSREVSDTPCQSVDLRWSCLNITSSFSLPHDASLPQVIPLSSLLREACCQHAPAAILGEWGVYISSADDASAQQASNQSLLLSIPVDTTVARIAIHALLPVLPRAVAQACGDGVGTVEL